MRFVLNILMFFVVFLDSLWNLWPDPGMRWYAKLMPGMDVDEAISLNCEEQGGLAHHIGTKIFCTDAQLTVYWSLEVGR